MIRDIQLLKVSNIKTHIMEKVEYNLSYLEALEIVANGGSVKGENFIDGIFLKMNRYEQLVTVDACRSYIEEDRVFFGSLTRQKFRELSVMTVKELSK
jgi:hypothetical protein